MCLPLEFHIPSPEPRRAIEHLKDINCQRPSTIQWLKFHQVNMQEHTLPLFQPPLRRRNPHPVVAQFKEKNSRHKQEKAGMFREM
ncbi:hypothetical protein A1O3_05818 [Capronia epimyces CBS 606.96]|uniref:Uncharacterized protein n=1 Tax=Capronia epimyces CBS 606.96 TaxID=1182542 RepID=W9XY17_9EURO|nr:uncharacterized protein A1O3_05818 [Capronia epimyces CBS 606.96]EXJ85143.1 hypothetical protein A1O3_05818 [Capronia epimyces CBS 606.96]